MNFSASAHPENTSAQQIESLRDWWSLAGVDLHYNDEPASLLGNIAPKDTPPEQEPVRIAAPTESRSNFVNKLPSPRDISEDFPAEYDDYISWLSKSENLIEAQWSKNRVLPSGVMEPEIMIIVGMPEQGGLVENSLFSSQSQALLANMMKAIGCDSENTYLASISLGRSLDGRIASEHHDIFKKRIIHHIGLVRPQKIIIFGDTPSNLFFNQNLLTARKNKQFVNHKSSKTDAIVTFHPRILLERPEFKTEAWKDLQLLTRIQSI